MSNSRQTILTALVQNQGEKRPLPDIRIPKAQTDLIAAFGQRVSSIGGQVVQVTALSDISDYLRLRIMLSGPTVTNIQGLSIGDYLSAHTVTGLSLETVELAVLQGVFGVAENGAIWLDDRDLPHRALPFICQHLALVLPQTALVTTLHEAYYRLEANRFDYGVLIAGPSKTADIEQSLVIGAHGARSLTVFLID